MEVQRTKACFVAFPAPLDKHFELKFEIHASVPESYVSKSDCIEVWGIETYITNIHDILRCLH